MTYDFSRDEQAALKAAWATEHGRAALTVVIERLGLMRQSSFNPDPYITALNEGRRFVALAVLDAISRPLKEADAGHDNSRGPVPTATERAARDAVERATGRKQQARAGTGTRRRK